MRHRIYCIPWIQINCSPFAMTHRWYRSIEPELIANHRFYSRISFLVSALDCNHILICYIKLVLNRLNACGCEQHVDTNNVRKRGSRTSTLNLRPPPPTEPKTKSWWYVARRRWFRNGWRILEQVGVSLWVCDTCVTLISLCKYDYFNPAYVRYVTNFRDMKVWRGQKLPLGSVRVVALSILHVSSA